MRIALFFVLTLVLASPAAGGECASDRMVKIIYQNATPGLSSDSIETAPKTLYRLGSKFARLEQATRVGVETFGLVITNLPDKWKVDTITKRGFYSYDPTDRFPFKAPVFPSYEDAEFLRALEFGCEFEYMQEHSDEPPEPAEISDRDLLNYTVRNGRYRVHLAVIKKTSTPIAIGLFKDDEMIHYFRYLQYRHLSFNPNLFYPPPDMEILVVD